MSVPSFLEGSEPIQRQQQKSQPSFLEGSEVINRSAPEGNTLRTAVVQPVAGGISGFAGTPGSLVDLIGTGLGWLGNKLTGGDFDYQASREQLKKEGLPGERERSIREFEGLDKLERGELSSTEKMALLMGEDDIAPPQAILPNVQEVSESIDSATGGFTAPRTANERISRRTGEFVGGSAFPLGGAATGEQLFAAAGGGLLSGAGEEAGVGPLGQLGLALLGTGVAGGTASVAKATPQVARNLATDFKGTVGRGVGKIPFLKVKPNQVRTEVIKAAKEEGIDLPLSAITDNETLRFLETTLAESSIAGPALENARKKMAEQFVNGVNKTFEGISQTAFENKAVAGTSIKNALETAQKEAQDFVRGLYNTSESLLPSTDVIKAPNLVRKVDSLINKLEKTVKPSAEEGSTLKFLKDLKSEFLEPVKKEAVQLVDAVGKPIKQAAKQVQREIPVEKIVGLKRSLNDTIDFTAQGGSKKLLRSLVPTVKEDLKAYAKKNPEFWDAYQLAEKEHGNVVQAFRNKDIKNALRQENPERLLDLGSGISKINKVEKAFNYLPEEIAKQEIASFKRSKAEDLLRDNLINPKESQVSYRKAANIFNDSNKTAIIKELAGKEGFKRLQNLKKVADGIVQGAEKFANPSKSGAKLTDIAAYVYLIKQSALSATTGNPLPLIKAGVGAYAPRLVADIITDRGFIENLIKVAEAGKSNNAQAYLKALEEAGRVLRVKVSQLENEGSENQ